MLRREVHEHIKVFTGQKSAVPFGALGPGDAARIINFVCRKGKLTKIWGGSLYTTPSLGTSGGITWLDRFRYRWFIQQNGVIALETAEGSKSFTTLASNFTTSATDYLGRTFNLRTRSEKWRELLFLVTGKENKYLDANRSTTKLFNLGLIPPGNGYATNEQPEFAFTNLGAGNVPENPEYLITWVDENGIESLPNGASVQEDGLWGGESVQLFTVAASREVEVDISDVKAVGYDTDRVAGWNLYRKVGGVFKKVNTTVTPIATDTFDDNVADADLGTVLNQDNSPPPDGTHFVSNVATNAQGVNTIGPRFARFWRDQLWLFGASYPGEASIQFTPVKSVLYASDVQNPDYFLYSFDVGRSSGEEDSGLAVHLNTLMILKERSIWAVDGTSPENYSIRQIDSRRGIIAPGSLQETPAGVIGLSSEGFILATGYGPATVISDEIFDEVKKINLSAKDKIVSAYNEKEGKYECQVPISPYTQNSLVFVYDVNFKTWQILKTRIGQSVKYDLSSSGAQVGLVGDQANARLYSVVDEDEVSFNGAAILAHWHSKHFDFGHGDKLKRLNRIIIKARSKTDFVLDFDIIMDFGKETVSYNDISSESTYSTWAEDQDDEDGMTWDQDNWSGEYVERKIEIVTAAIATNFQIIVRESENSAARAGFEIEEIILEANLLRR